MSKKIVELRNEAIKSRNCETSKYQEENFLKILCQIIWILKILAISLHQ